jgi:hypothetical protein
MEKLFCHSVECNTRKDAVNARPVIDYHVCQQEIAYRYGMQNILITITMVDTATQKTKCSFKEGDWFYKMQNREFTYGLNIFVAAKIHSEKKTIFQLC